MCIRDSVDAVQAHERIEDQKARLEFCDGVFEALAVSSLIDSHRGGGDDVNVQILQIAPCGGTDPLEPAAHDMQGILGRVQQHPAGTSDGEAAQTRGALSLIHISRFVCILSR